jgi:fibronectin type 3 domain-containing protein
MEPFRLRRGCRLGIAPGQLALRRARRRLALGLTAAALIAVMASWPAMLGAAGTSPARVGPSGAGASLVLTAMVGPQARVLNPGPPTGLSASAGNGQVTLSWKAPVEDGGSAIAGYDVYEGTSSGGESGSSVNGSLIAGTSDTVTGLTNGTTYYFTAVSVNGGGLQSNPSNEASATPVAPVTAPGAPTGLSATAGDAQVTLSWKAPSSDGGEKITSYDVFEGSAANFKASSPAASSSGTSVTVKGLTNGKTYYFEVAAVNGVGAGPASGSVSATPAAAITAPAAPGGLTATGGKGQVSLSWTAPGSTGGAAISGYIIYSGTSAGGESASPVTGSPVKGTSYTVTGLANGTKYYFKVAAVNADKQQGKDSGEASAKTLSASASASASPSASASQSPSAGASGPAGATGIPGAPGGLTATPGNAEARLSWNAPASDGGSPLVSYRVYQGTSAGFAITTPVTTIPVAGTTSTGTGGTGAAVTSSTSMTTTVTGLTNGKTYYFVVTAVSADGQTSGSSNEASVEPSVKAVLTSASRVPRPVIISLAAVAVVATLAALALAARLLRPHSKPSAVPPSDVRAVPDPGLPSVVSVHEYGTEETYTVRLEPLPAAIITTLEEVCS